MYHHRFKSAAAVLHDIIQKEPGNARAWYLLAQTYLANNQVKAAGSSSKGGANANTSADR